MIASALIASTEDLNRPDDDPRMCDGRASALDASAKYTCEASQELLQIVPDPARNRIDVIDLIANVLAGACRSRDDTAFFVALTPKIIHESLQT